MVYAMKMKCGLFGHNSWPGFTVSKPMNMKVRIKLAAKSISKVKIMYFKNALNNDKL